MTAVATPSTAHQAPAGSVAPAPTSGSALRPVTSTLVALRRRRAALIVLALLFGVAGAFTVQQRGSGTHDAVAHSGPLTVQAEKLYHSLSDADATAATAFLSVGTEPPELRAKYIGDLAAASAALTTATSEAAGDKQSALALATIAQQLPLYTGEIESARANNLQGLPIGPRYLNQASQLMQGTILQAANDLATAEAANLAAAGKKSTSIPYLEIAAGLAVLLALLAVQRAESGRTHRTVNPALLAATAAVLVSVLWMAGAFALETGQVHQAEKNGSAQVAVLAAARIESLRARSDEMLTLVARGSAPADETKFAQTDEPATASSLASATSRATDVQGRALAQKAVTDEAAWKTAHADLHALDNANDYVGALRSALGATAKSGGASANTDFQLLQTDLDAAITGARARFHSHSTSADDALFGAAAGMALLALAVAAAVSVGLGRRIAEYR